jgi:hypothetical protein
VLELYTNNVGGTKLKRYYIWGYGNEQKRLNTTGLDDVVASFANISDFVRFFEFMTCRKLVLFQSSEEQHKKAKPSSWKSLKSRYMA